MSGYARNVTFQNPDDWTKAQGAWNTSQAEQGRGKDAQGNVMGTDGIAYKGASPFIAEPDEQGNTQDRFNRFIADNHHQGTAGEPGRQFVKFANQEAKDAFDFQTNKLWAMQREGQSNIERMFHTALLGQASMAYGFAKS